MPAIAIALHADSVAQTDFTILPPGHRPEPPGVHALVGARVIVQPGETIENATIILRDGKIEAVGADLEPPADARVWPLEGLTVYPGFIDAALALKSGNANQNNGNSQSLGAAPHRASGSAYAQNLGSGSIQFYGVTGEETDPGDTGPGHEIHGIHPERRAVDGLALDAKTRESLHQIGLTAANVLPSGGILRGTSAFILLGEADPNELVLDPDVFQHVTFEPSGSRNRYPASLMGVIAAVRQVFLDARHQLSDESAGDAAPPRAFNPALRALDPAVRERMKVVFEPQSALMVDRAAQLARELGLDPIILASGQEWRRLDLATRSGTPMIVPLAFPQVPKLPEEEDWTDVSLDQLRAWDWAPENPAALRNAGVEFALSTFGLSDRKKLRANLRAAIDRGLTEQDALAALTTIPAALCGVDDQLGSIAPGKLANLTVVQGNYFDPDSKVREVWVRGRIYRVEHVWAGAEPDDAEEDEKSSDAKAREKAREARSTPRVARSPQEGRGPISAPKAILIRGATLWTCGDAGRIENGSLLAIDGKIRAIGRTPLEAENNLPEDILIIEASGKHVTPGLIDTHSHAMILGAVNEATIPSSAMVRIGDVINSESDNIYEQLAGGLTVANLLHGSANPIGGQSAVIKLRNGAAPDELRFEGAPPGIKFALGENVKQSNWGSTYTTRFPQTRMGVPTFFRNRFIAARQYLRAWEHFRESGGRPPRRDLELEAIAEIIEGERWIHCHSYRQDEILAFLRLMESFGVKIGTFQHVLEGYKVADEIAAHGAGASCFSDWWAYKFEVYDAIPYAGAIMHNRGVLVSFNSDDADLARRLYVEAAKAVKYGGVPEEEALRFVTLNPARQLRIDDRVGSLEAGKDADFVIWSESPLQSTTVCLETWIEGKQYFDRHRSQDLAEARRQERIDLLEKARRVSGLLPKKDDNKTDAEEDTFFRVALEHLHDHVTRHCDDE